MHRYGNLIVLSLVSMLLIGFGWAQSTTSEPIPAATLPAYMHTECYSTKTPWNTSLISTTAKMMDWCGCENKLNPDGRYYAGMSVYENNMEVHSDEPSGTQTARTWICSAHTNQTCDSIVDWYQALGNVSATCGNNAGYFYDALRQIAWGFDVSSTTDYCEQVAWIGIMNGDKKTEDKRGVVSAAKL